ncbi:hypothetical protein MSAN_02494400 [Mycena sanguinolenta]|uniref:Uncharacterized protein n=1 Tax=Mycena sanguinolenta TaxID=230812 RepID=A0A8H6WT74_9AGAR|nr:hypothetical protein MSAN_02494400 [Mycena sanguinolenta]
MCIRYSIYIMPQTAHPVALIRLLYSTSLHEYVPPHQSDVHMYTARGPILHRLQPAFRLSWAEEGSIVFREQPARDLFRVARSAQVIVVIPKLSRRFASSLVCWWAIASSKLNFTVGSKDRRFQVWCRHLQLFSRHLYYCSFSVLNHSANSITRSFSV